MRGHSTLVLIHPCMCCRRGWGSSLLGLRRPVNLKIPCSFIVFLCLLWETISLRAETCLLSSSRSDCSWTVAMLVATLYFRPSKVNFFVWARGVFYQALFSVVANILCSPAFSTKWGLFPTDFLVYNHRTDIYSLSLCI